MHRSAPAAGSTQYSFRSLTSVPQGDSRSITFIASDESVDRMGDVIRVGGWDLRNFKANPVLLWAHQSRELPIGKVTDIRIEGSTLVADAEFVEADMNPKAEQVLRMIKAGVLNATSVGFRPLEAPLPIKNPHNDQTTGFEFVKQELFELSVVPIPANANALAVTRSFVDSDVMFYESLLRDSGASAAEHAKRMRDIDHLTRRRSPV